MKINERVKSVIKEKGYKVSEVAVMIGINRQSLYSRLKDPKYSTLRLIADAINVPVEAFFNDHFSVTELRCPCCGEKLLLFVK